MNINVLTSRLFRRPLGIRPAGGPGSTMDQAGLSCRRRERALGVALALLALVVYVWTLCPGVFPGLSAVACAGVLRVLPGNPVIGHPLWAWASRLAAALPLGDVPLRLNLFSALCGAGAVMLLFRLTTLLLYEALRDEIWVVQMEKVADSPATLASQLADEKERIQTIRRNHQHAMAGGVVTALVFAFCAPFWSASVSLYAQTFDLLLLLAASYVLARYMVTGLPVYFVVTAFLCGLGLVESAAFLVFLPVMLASVFYVAKCQAQISESFLVLFLSSLGTGLLLALGALALWQTHGGASLSGAELMRMGTALLHNHGDSLKAGLPRMGWMLLILQGVVPALTIYWGARSFFFTRDPLSACSWGAINAIFSALAAFTLLNLPGSCWHMTRDGAYLPIIPLLGTAMSCGGLFVYAFLLGRGPNRNEIDDDAPPVSPLPRIAGMLLSAAIILVVLVAPFRNFKEADGRAGAFAGVFCRELLEAVPQAQCLVTEGTFDANLLVQAHLMRRRISLLHEDHGRSAPPVPGEPSVIQSAPQTAISLVQTWLQKNPAAASQVAFLTAPGLWARAGFQAVPNLLVYIGEKQQERILPAVLLERHRPFWQRIEPLLGHSRPPRVAALYRAHIAMRMQASRIANDLGVLCLHKNALTDAAEAFRQAQAMDANNLCAFINLYGLCLERPEIGDMAQLQERMAVFMARRPVFAAMADYENCYGTLHRPAVEYLVTRNTPQRLPQPPNQPDVPLMAQLTEYCRSFVLSESLSRLTPRPLVSGALDEEVSSATRAVMSGQWRAAEAKLRHLIHIRRNLLPAWALLAEVLMNTDRLDDVQNEVLPSMRLATTSKDTELIDMIEGCLALRRKQPDFAAAHACFSRVLQRNPNIEEAQRQFLHSSLALGNANQIERDCTNLLARTPGHPLANALLGSLRLSQGRLEEAESALATSVANQPTASALNDLAETLRQTRRFQAAEAAARRALLLNPGCYQAWDTLGMILSDVGHLDDAAAAHQAALQLCRTDIRLYLSAAALEQKRHRPETARSLLAAAAPMLAQASAACKENYASLLRAP